MQIVEFTVDSTLPVLTSNFDEVKANLVKYLAKYDIEVTHETVKDAKKLATELNSICKKGEDSVKDKLKVFEAPINVVKTQLKEIVGLYQDARAKITNQVKVFEDKTRIKCSELLKAELQEQYVKLKIKDEFKTVAIDDLVLISHVTDTGNLAKSARDAISERVHIALSLQNLVHVRLVELENTSLKAGLKSPLERRHVESFLKTDDEVYNIQLNKVFENEIRRQKEIEEKIIADQKKAQEKREAEIRAEEERKHKIELERIQKEQAKKQRLENEIKVKENEIKTSTSEIPTSPVIKESLVNKNEDNIIEIKQKLYIDEDGGEHGEERNSLSIVVNDEILFSMRDGMCPEDAYFCRDLNDVYNIFPAIQKACQYVKDGFNIRFIKEDYLVDEDDNDILHETKLISEINATSNQAAESFNAVQGVDTFTVTATFKVQIESSKMATIDAVKGKFVKTLSDRGFETVQSVNVSKTTN